MSSVLGYIGHDLLRPDIVRAENCSLFDADGRRWVDLESGVWCTVIGHGHPRIQSVLREQSARIAHAGFGYTSPVVEEAAEEILSALGFDGGRCVFLCSGSEAVEYGVRVARVLAGERLLVTMADSYFGAYGSARERRSDEWFAVDWIGGADAASVPFDRVGGFLFEPGSSSGLVRFPPAPLVREIAAEVRARGGLVGVNEVTTGVGRTGEWCGYQHYGLEPDFVALGKGIGNGYPVSVCAFAPGVIERLGGTPIAYAQSHQNDPLGAVVAREVVRVIRDDALLERGRQLGVILGDGLRRIRDRSSVLREIRVRGLMAAIEFNDDAAATRAARTQRTVAQRGYLLARRPGLAVLRVDPALTVERTDLSGFLEEFAEVVRAAEGLA